MCNPGVHKTSRIISHLWVFGMSRDRIDDLLLAFRESLDLGPRDLTAATSGGAGGATEQIDNERDGEEGSSGSSLKRQLSLLFVRSWRQVRNGWSGVLVKSVPSG
jgi:hypothetical protein